MIVMSRRFSDVRIHDTETCPTIETGSGEGGNNLPMIVDTLIFDESQITCPTNGLNPKWGGQCHSLTREAGRTVVIIKGDEQMETYQDTTGSLLASGYNKLGTQEAANDMYVAPAYSATTGDFMVASKEQTSTLMARDYKDPPITTKARSVVRRLTPKECERLQAFPDDWTNIGEWVDSKGKKHKDADSPRYKALGNSIALPFWAWLARRICAQYERPMTMASLFDGIGGFPLVFSRCGAIPVWASEIEEFPIAVTKHHFPEEEA